MRGRPAARWWSIADELDVLICDAGPAGCVKGWGPGTHRDGKVDENGVIHWSGWKRRSSLTGLHHVLKMVAEARRPELFQDRSITRWVKVYEANWWAYKTGVTVFGYRIRYEATKRDRERVRKLATRYHTDRWIRERYPDIYNWMYWKPPRARRTMKTGGAMSG